MFLLTNIPVLELLLAILSTLTEYKEKVSAIDYQSTFATEGYRTDDYSFIKVTTDAGYKDSYTSCKTARYDLLSLAFVEDVDALFQHFGITETWTNAVKNAQSGLYVDGTSYPLSTLIGQVSIDVSKVEVAKATDHSLLLLKTEDGKYEYVSTLATTSKPAICVMRLKFPFRVRDHLKLTQFQTSLKEIISLEQNFIGFLKSLAESQIQITSEFTQESARELTLEETTDLKTQYLRELGTVKQDLSALVTKLVQSPRLGDPDLGSLISEVQKELSALRFLAIKVASTVLFPASALSQQFIQNLDRPNFKSFGDSQHSKVETWISGEQILTKFSKVNDIASVMSQYLPLDEAMFYDMTFADLILASIVILNFLIGFVTVCYNKIKGRKQANHPTLDEVKSRVNRIKGAKRKGTALKQTATPLLSPRPYRVNRITANTPVVYQAVPAEVTFSSGTGTVPRHQIRTSRSLSPENIPLVKRRAPNRPPPRILPTNLPPVPVRYTPQVRWVKERPLWRSPSDSELFK